MKLKLISPTDPNAPPCSSCGKPARLQVRLEHKDDFLLLCGVCAWALVGDMPTEVIEHITQNENNPMSS